MSELEKKLMRDVAKLRKVLNRVLRCGASNLILRDICRVLKATAPKKPPGLRR